MHKRDYKIGSFKFLKQGMNVPSNQFNYAQVSNKKNEVIYIFQDPRDDTWYFLHNDNTEFNVINLNRFVKAPYYQYKNDQIAKEALRGFKLDNPS
jgi:hypothetical protein